MVACPEAAAAPDCQCHHSYCTPAPHPTLAAWIARQQAAGVVPRSPLTNQPLGDLSLRPNHTLRSLIAGLRAARQL